MRGGVRARGVTSRRDALRVGPARRPAGRRRRRGQGPGRRWTPLGRRGRGCGRPGGRGRRRPSRRPHWGCCRRREDCGGLRAVPAAAARALGDGPELVTVGVREAEQRPLLRSLFRRVLVAALSGSLVFSSPLGGVVRPVPGDLLASRLRGGDGLGVSCSLFRVWRPPPGPWVRWQPVPAFCPLPECLWLFRSLPRRSLFSSCSASGSAPIRRAAPPPCPG